MGYTKDLWTKPRRDEHGKVVRDKDGKVVREPNARWGKGKRWQANWTDPDGEPDSRVMQNKTQANNLWRDMESDRDRGEYVDPRAGKGLFDPLAQAWLAALTVDPRTQYDYALVYRTHVKPVFGSKRIAAIKPSAVHSFLAGLGRSTAVQAKVIISGVMDLAQADGAVRDNPARSRAVKISRAQAERVVAWSDDWVFGIIDAHPPAFKLMPYIGAMCGLRISEQFGLAFEDVDFDAQVIHVRRQIKRLGNEYVFALPKGGKERDVPLPEEVAEEIRLHVKARPPQACALPWAKPDGPPRVAALLFRWTDGKHMRLTAYDTAVWKPALAAAGAIPPPEVVETTRPSGRTHKRTVYLADRRHGTHQMRHWFASVQLADGVNIKELAEYLGHGDPGFTLRVYTHMQTTSHDRSRKATDRRIRARRLTEHPDLAEVEQHTTQFYPDRT